MPPPPAPARGVAQLPDATSAYVPNNAYWRNNAGGTITSRQAATGKYEVVLGGQATDAGVAQTILLSAWGVANICATMSWGKTGADLTVELACYDSSGAPASTPFVILMIQ